MKGEDRGERGWDITPAPGEGGWGCGNEGPAPGEGGWDGRGVGDRSQLERRGGVGHPGLGIRMGGGLGIGASR